MQSAVPLALAMAALAVPPLQARNAITLLLIDGKVWTGNPEKKRAEAVAIAGNRIAAVGSTAQILKLRQRATRVFDLEGHLVLPGFDDARVHFYPGGADLTGPQLRYARSAAEFRDTLADFAAHVPKGQWITGGNWDCEEWKTPRPPSHQLIDSATKNWPVFLKSAGGRMWLANKLALRLASIDRSTPDPPGGIAVRDARGNPTGILKGAARELVERVIPPPSEEQIVTALEEAQAYANARGVTSVRDISCTPGVPRAYRTMFRTGRLTVRVTCALLGSGSTPPFGSDWDNGSMNVMKGIYEAVTRRTPAPGRKITVEEAVRAYCAGRSIEPGKLADFVVLSNDIFSIDPSKIPGTEVLATIFNGVPVYGYLSPLRDKSGLILR